MKKNYRVIRESCDYCKYRDIVIEWDEPVLYMCTKDGPRPTSGSLYMEEECSHEEWEAFEEYYEEHKVSLNGICDSFKAKEEEI